MIYTCTCVMSQRLCETGDKRRSTCQKYIDLTDVTHRQSNEPEDVVVQKSDGTSLYVTRDIAAFISRLMVITAMILHHVSMLQDTKFDVCI